MQGDRFDGIRFDQDYDFALPRLGVTFTPGGSTTLFASWSASGREPAFRDLYDLRVRGKSFTVHAVPHAVAEAGAVFTFAIDARPAAAS